MSSATRLPRRRSALAALALSAAVVAGLAPAGLAPSAAAAELPGQGLALPQLRRDGGRDPRRREPPTPRSSTSSRSARPTRAGRSGRPRSATTSATDETGARDPVRRPAPRPRAPDGRAGALPARDADDRLRDGREVTALVDNREICHRLHAQPGRRRVRPDRPGTAPAARTGPGARTASRTPGSTYVGTDLNRNYDYRWGCCGGSSGTQVVDHLPRPVGLLGARDPGDPRLRQQPGRRAAASRSGRTSRSTRTASSILYPYGYTKTNVPVDMTSDRPRARSPRSARARPAQRLRAQQSSDLYITDGDQIDWMYGGTGSSRSPGSCTRPRRRPCGATTTRPTSRSRRRRPATARRCSTS